MKLIIAEYRKKTYAILNFGCFFVPNLKDIIIPKSKKILCSTDCLEIAKKIPKRNRYTKPMELIFWFQCDEDKKVTKRAILTSIARVFKNLEPTSDIWCENHLKIRSPKYIKYMRVISETEISPILGKRIRFKDVTSSPKRIIPKTRVRIYWVLENYEITI